MSPRSRRQSKSSFQEPLTPLRNSMNESELNELSGGGMGQDNGLGNLADELADALSGSGDDEEYYDDEEGSRVELQQNEDDGQNASDGVRDSGVDVASQSNQHGRSKSTSLGIPSPPGRGHRRTGSAYDGSEYGSESDLDSPGMPPSLVARIDAVESLARRGTESNGGPTDGVFQRLTEGLRDLGSQSGVEGSTTR